MKIALRLLVVISLVSLFAFAAAAQNREKFVISAHAGGVNAVTGRATMRTAGGTDWQQLTSQDDLGRGDVVRTGLDGRVELLLNPGSYLRVGENSEFELTDNSLDNLEVKLIRGTAIVEVTGADDAELLINITTPHARMAIVRRGLYRVNVVPGDATELIVRKGRVMLDRNHTKIKGGNKVVFSDTSFSVAKLTKADEDSLDAWSKNRAQTLARANSRMSNRDVRSFLTSYDSNWWYLSTFGSRGLWFYNASIGCYTLVPLTYGWGSPYGGAYSMSFFGNYCCRRIGIPGLGSYGVTGTPVIGTTSGAGSGSGSGSGSGVGTGLGPGPAPLPASPVRDSGFRGRDVSSDVHRTRNP
ncbi:MAG TPA: FecR family protein [Pyrinomonadaceae bacterium]|nr:FecR family protein [Pyrinomonadaceae bacterium]